MMLYKPKKRTTTSKELMGVDEDVMYQFSTADKEEDAIDYALDEKSSELHEVGTEKQ